MLWSLIYKDWSKCPQKDLRILSPKIWEFQPPRFGNSNPQERSGVSSGKHSQSDTIGFVKTNNQPSWTKFGQQAFFVLFVRSAWGTCLLKVQYWFPIKFNCILGKIEKQLVSEMRKAVWVSLTLHQVKRGISAHIHCTLLCPYTLFSLSLPILNTSLEIK